MRYWYAVNGASAAWDLRSWPSSVDGFTYAAGVGDSGRGLEEPSFRTAGGKLNPGPDPGVAGGG